MSSISLIITTYNRPKALVQVLKAVAKQHYLPDEVIIADDGSGEETESLIQKQAKHYPCELKHIWQQDQGFRAARARNQAVAESQCDYLIFIDGDSLPLMDFCKEHCRLREKGYFVSGQRILFNMEMTKRIEQEIENPISWNREQWLIKRWKGHINRLSPLQKLPGQWWRKGGYQKKRWQGAKTCNLALWRHDFLAVNGFDEMYQGWGHEDADLVIRLLHYGCLRKTGRYAVPVLHLWHSESDRSHEAENLRRLKKRMRQATLILAEQGVEQYL